MDGKRNELKIVFIQHDIEEGNPRKTARHLLWRIRLALKKRPDLVLLPEVFLGGPSRKNELPEYARFHAEFVAELHGFAQNTGTRFFGSVIEKRKGHYYNAAILISPEGPRLQVYRKIHLFRFDREHELFGAGVKSPLFTTPWGKAAPLVCYDIRFPELLRKMAFQGARFALVCAQWPESRREHWLVLLRARALENQMFVIACNRTGVKRNLSFSGDSCVVSPWGEILYMQKCGSKTGYYTADLRLVETIREKYPFLKDADRRRIRFDI